MSSRVARYNVMGNISHSLRSRNDLKLPGRGKWVMFENVWCSQWKKGVLHENRPLVTNLTLWHAVPPPRGSLIQQQYNVFCHIKFLIFKINLIWPNTNWSVHFLIDDYLNNVCLNAHAALRKKWSWSFQGPKWSMSNKAKFAEQLCQGQLNRISGTNYNVS